MGVLDPVEQDNQAACPADLDQLGVTKNDLGGDAGGLDPGQAVAFDDELVAAWIPFAEEKVAAVGQASVFGYTQAVVLDEPQLALLLG